MLQAVFDLLRHLTPTVRVPPWVFGLLRRSAPVVFVLRYAHVLEVLGDHERFTVELYDAKMRATLGPFVLGRGWHDDDYHGHSGYIRDGLTPARCERLRGSARARATALVAAVRRRGQLDVVRELARTVVPECIGELCGFDPVTAEGDAVADLVHATGRYVFDPFAGPAEQVAGRRAGRRLGAHLERAIARSGRGADHLIGHLCSEPLDARQVRDLVAGTASGGIGPTLKLFPLVMARLLALPEADFVRLQEVARTGSDAALWCWLREAARFSPVPPVLYRFAPYASMLGRETGRPTRVPEGSLVVANVVSASRDPDAVQRPEDFWPERPARQYLLFGSGQHHCVGATPERDVAQALLTEMARPVLALPRVRARRPDAAANDSLVVQFDQLT